MACPECLDSPSPPGVSKTVMVDVKGSGPLWLKLRDLADGVTYNFRIRAKTFMYGPEVAANITTGPGEGSAHDLLTRVGGGVTLPSVGKPSPPSRRSSRTPWGALHHTLRCGPDHPLEQRRSRARSHHALCDRGQAFRCVGTRPGDEAVKRLASAFLIA